MEKDSLKNLAKGLINRNFQISDIKSRLAEKNFTIDEIENVFSEIKDEHFENSKNSIFKKQGLK